MSDRSTPDGSATRIAEPAPFGDYLDHATDYTIFRGQLRNAIDYALRNFGLTHDHAGRAVTDNEAWQQAARDELAERIAIHLCAGLAPVMEQHNRRTFLGALAALEAHAKTKEAEAERDALKASIARVRVAAAIHPYAEDTGDLHRGYRICSERVLAALEAE